MLKNDSPVLSCADCGAGYGSPCPGTVRPVAACIWNLPLDTDRILRLNEAMTQHNERTQETAKQQSYLYADSLRKNLTIKVPGHWVNLLPGDIVAFSAGDEGATVTAKEPSDNWLGSSHRVVYHKFQMTKAEAIQLGEELWEATNHV
jgi:hypothetical protein